MMTLTGTRASSLGSLAFHDESGFVDECADIPDRGRIDDLTVRMHSSAAVLVCRQCY